MTEQALAQVLAECTEEVLEQMFFVRPLGASNSASLATSSDLVAKVDFTGEPSGRLTLAVSAQAARAITADFLAEEERVLTEQQVEEVVCELVNIICGSVLTRVESRTLFRLGTPRLERQSRQPESPQTVVQSLTLWNGNLTVALSTESPICPSAAASAS